SVSESFTALRDKRMYYVDKTGFIPYLIQRGDEICVFTRPRRFGKTLMLRTLQTFFEYKLDADGKPVDNRRYFEGLKVMDAGDDVLKEMGQYPVISLSFKDVFDDTYEKVVSMLNDAVAEACVPHGNMLKASGKLSEAYTQNLQAYMDGKALEEDLPKFLRLYMQWLNDVTGRKTVVLLDEYDVPLQKAAIYDMHNPGCKLFDKVVTLIGKFISAGFKSNNNLAYGIIAGCMRVAKESIFTGMNNPGVITVLDRIPDEYWGFTQPEVEKMLAYYDLSDKMDALKHWYEGYYYSEREVYNPWSLLNAIRGLVNGYGEDAIQSYWARTSGNDIIDEMIEQNPDHRNKLAQMMNGEPLWTPVFQDLSYRDLNTYPESIWSFLLYTGYLKSIQKRQLDTGNWEALVTIPNMEIRSVMNQAMQHWWKNIKLQGWDAQKLLRALLTGDAENAERELRLVLCDSTSVFDYNEAFYHGMLVGLLRNVAMVHSNDEYGEGRPDVVALAEDTGIILEVKCVTPKALKAAGIKDDDRAKIKSMMMTKLDEAEKQIRANEYIEAVLEDEPIARTAKAYAVCFCKKRCMVREVGVV
ncbi:MAG: AAA family ATPase, partial [Proteobacteria bacterium]|nr:AAA family ATPase [Pseudomonadota bacterium]